MPKKSSFTTTIASISRLLPKRKKRGGGSHQHRNTHDDGSFSSSASSSEEDRCSDMSEGTEERGDRSSSRSDGDNSRFGRLNSRGSHHKGKLSRRGHRSSDHRRHPDRDRNRGRRNEFYSPNSHGDHHTPQRHHKTVGGDEATRAVDLLMRILPLYGKGDSKLDTLVLDTMDRLPSHALEMKDVDGNTLLLIACQTGAYDLLSTLLEKGCSVNARNNLGASCLHYACSVESFAPDVAMALLRHGASAEIADLQFLSTPLHLAAYSGHIELCAELCRSGANPTTVDRNGFDSLHYSKQNGHLACAQLLLSYTQPRDVTSPNDVSKSADWVRYIDDSTGAVFFHNIETGTSVWGDPRIGDQDGDGQIPEQVESTGASVDQKVKPSDNADDVFQSPDSRKMNRYEINMPSDISMYASQRALQHDKQGNFPRPGTLPSIAAVKENFLQPPSLGTAKALRSPTNPLSPDGLSAKSLANSQVLEEKMSSMNKQMESELMHRLQELENKIIQQNIEVPHKAGFDSSHSKENIADLMSTIVKLQMDVSAKELEILTLDRKLAAAEKNSKIISAHANVGDGNVNVMDDRLELNLVELLADRESQVLESENKDREIFLLLEKVAKLEARDHSGLPRLDAAVSNLEPDAKIAYQQELDDAQNEISLLRGQLDEAKKSISVANGRYEETRSRLDIAEQSARVEKASRMSTESLLEQTKNREKSDSGLAQLVQEEKRMAEETVRQLKGQLQVIEDKALVERGNHRQELERLDNKCSVEQARAAQLTKELEKAMAVHRTNIAELRDQHKVQLGKANEEFIIMKASFDSATAKLKEIEEKCEMQEVFHSKMKASYELEVGQLRNELDGTKTEVVNVNAKLKEATIVKMELMVAKHDSDVAMESAIEKARLAESKLQKMTEFISRTEELKMTNDKLQISLQDQTEKRKMLHNTLEDLKGRIRVYVRVRPLSESEIKSNCRIVLSKEDERTCVMEEDAATASDARDWEFDKIFCGSDMDGNTQDAVFKDTSLLVTSAIDGFNVCIFAYGQTGSGKTFTMIGSDSDKGIAPRVAHDLFQKLRERESIHHIEVSASILELYSDKLRDLLVPGNDEFHDDHLKIRLAEHTSSGLVEVEGSRTEHAANAKELLDIFDRGAKSRASSSTKMNSVSSRSHMIVTIVLTFRNKRTNDVMHGKLTLVDLAGSERVSKSGATGLQLKEAQSINKSLSALGDVIGALTSKGHPHIPYRNNPLTMLMSDSIGGNAKTLMFVCCSPADYNRRESSDSLDFAKRCRNVTNNAQSSNASAANVHQIRALRAELLKMKEKVTESTPKRPSAGVKSPERDRNFLPKLQQTK